MTRLILTSSDAAPGRLLGAGLADIVIPLGFRLVSGPLPSDAALQAMLGPGSLDHFPRRRLGEFHSSGMGVIDLCERCETIELWFDPSPNAQLILIQLLDYLGSRTTLVSKLTLFQADVDIAEQTPEAIAKWRPAGAKIRNAHLEAAGMAWRAYRQPTPQRWTDLLDDDLDILPQLRRTVLELLEELPMPATGLGATEMRMLELIAAGDATPFDVFPGHDKPNRRRVFGYWDVGALLDGLARGRTPAVAGLEAGPFTEALHEDADHLARYRQSNLSLTALGKAVLAQTEDFSRHNPIDRWWGGTQLKSDNLWRWNAVSGKLIAP